MSSIGVHASRARYKGKRLLENHSGLEPTLPRLLDSIEGGEQEVEWIPIQDSGFIAADVIRWKEGVYAHRRGRNAKAPRLGDRLVTAEVLQGADADGWVQLLVRKCEILLEISIIKPPLIAEKTQIRRALKTIMRGKPERLLWSDESARVLVADKASVFHRENASKKVNSYTKTYTRKRRRKKNDEIPKR
jgi:hypothetical protein